MSLFVKNWKADGQATTDCIHFQRKNNYNYTCFDDDDGD